MADSVIMTDNLVTVELSLFRRRLGGFHNMTAVDSALRVTLALRTM